MVFGLGKKKKEDIEEVKEAVMPQAPMMQRPADIPELDRIDIPSVTEPKQFAPLFIKIDKYKEVLQKIQKLKAIIKNIDSLLRLQEQIDRTEDECAAMLKKHVEEFSQIATQLDNELLRPQHFEPYIRQTGVQSMAPYTKDIEDEISKLKDQLRTI